MGKFLKNHMKISKSRCKQDKNVLNLLSKRAEFNYITTDLIYEDSLLFLSYQESMDSKSNIKFLIENTQPVCYSI